MSDKYAFIAREEGNFPVRKMCQWAQVSRSGYYEWKDRAPSPSARRRATLAELVEAIYSHSDGTYGYRRVHAELGRAGYHCDPQTVLDIMRELGLAGARPRRKGPRTTIAADAGDLPDLVKRDFTAEEPGLKLVGDITYIDTWEGWVYLATVLDCCTKKVVGYALADHMRTSLVTDALAMASRNGHIRPRKTVFHSDRGTQYMSAEFKTFTERLEITRSVGRTGICYDNALAESFNASLKVERVYRTAYPTRKHAYRDIARYIEVQYNHKRLHSSLGYRTPNEVEQDWIILPKAA